MRSSRCFSVPRNFTDVIVFRVIGVVLLALLPAKRERGARATLVRHQLAGFASNHLSSHRRACVDRPKTESSAETMDLSLDLISRLQVWRQRTEFSSGEDWLLASPVKIGRLPYSYTGVGRELKRTATAAGIGMLGTHSFRHTYRSWLDAVGTALAVQKKAMRHSDIRTTMNVYGDVVDGRVRE
ncbi:MAG: tyrosine-type recombinase/integrase, partial [Candidatus Sulfotelmatobacter sp.]